MRVYAAAFVSLTLLAAPVMAQSADEEDAPSLMERGAQQFLEGLLLEMEPAWAEFQKFLDAMGPALSDMMDEVQDWSNYEPPEILENGDIIIRRKPEIPAPAPIEPDPTAPPQIEL